MGPRVIAFGFPEARSVPSQARIPAARIDFGFPRARSEHSKARPRMYPGSAEGPIGALGSRTPLSRPSQSSGHYRSQRRAASNRPAPPPRSEEAPSNPGPDRSGEHLFPENLPARQVLDPSGRAPTGITRHILRSMTIYPTKAQCAALQQVRRRLPCHPSILWWRRQLRGFANRGYKGPTPGYKGPKRVYK